MQDVCVLSRRVIWGGSRRQRGPGPQTTGAPAPRRLYTPYPNLTATRVRSKAHSVRPRWGAFSKSWRVTWGGSTLSASTWSASRGRRPSEVGGRQMRWEGRLGGRTGRGHERRDLRCPQLWHYPTAAWTPAARPAELRRLAQQAYGLRVLHDHRHVAAAEALGACAKVLEVWGAGGGRGRVCVGGVGYVGWGRVVLGGVVWCWVG